MRYIKILVVLSIITACLSSLNARQGESNDKISLSFIVPTNKMIDSLAADITKQIGKKQYGHQWPVTKIVFYKTNGQVYIDVTAIDNSWFRLFSPNEEPYGHFVVNNRLFIVSVKNGEPLNLSNFFRKTTKARQFDKPDAMITLYKEMPVWSYRYSGYKGLELIGTKHLDRLNQVPE